MKDNSGRYGEDFSKPPTKGANESPQAYQQRLKEWQRRRSMSGSAGGNKKPAAAPEKKESAGGWADRVVSALKGKKK